MSINNEDRDTFLVGCDSGGLFKCSFSSTMAASTSMIFFHSFKFYINFWIVSWFFVYNVAEWNEDFPIQLFSPVKLGFDPQNGPVHSISSSPFHRNLFLSCGTDSEIKLYSLLQVLNKILLLFFFICISEEIQTSINNKRLDPSLSSAATRASCTR